MPPSAVSKPSMSPPWGASVRPDIADRPSLAVRVALGVLRGYKVLLSPLLHRRLPVSSVLFELHGRSHPRARRRARRLAGPRPAEPVPPVGVVWPRPRPCPPELIRFHAEQSARPPRRPFVVPRPLGLQRCSCRRRRSPPPPLTRLRWAGPWRRSPLKALRRAAVAARSAPTAAQSAPPAPTARAATATRRRHRANTTSSSRRSWSTPCSRTAARVLTNWTLKNIHRPDGPAGRSRRRHPAARRAASVLGAPGRSGADQRS